MFSHHPGVNSIFSPERDQHRAINGPRIRAHRSRNHSLLIGMDHVVQIPFGSRDGALSQIETLLESILDAIIHDDELVIPYQSARSLQAGPGQVSARKDGRQLDVLRFPGRTIQEAKKFGTVVTLARHSNAAEVKLTLLVLHQRASSAFLSCPTRLFSLEISSPRGSDPTWLCRPRVDSTLVRLKLIWPVQEHLLPEP